MTARSFVAIFITMAACSGCPARERQAETPRAPEAPATVAPEDARRPDRSSEGGVATAPDAGAVDAAAPMPPSPSARPFPGGVDACSGTGGLGRPPGDRCEACDYCAASGSDATRRCALWDPHRVVGFCTVPCSRDEDCPEGWCGLLACTAACSALFEGRSYCVYTPTGPLPR